MLSIFLKDVVVDVAKLLQVENEEGIIIKQDPIISIAANLAYSQIVSYCKRPFEKQLITEIYEGIENDRVQLRMSPVDIVLSVRRFGDDVDFDKVSQTGNSIIDQSVIAIIDEWLDLEKKKISNVVVKDADTRLITYVENEDYILDANKGLIKYITGDGTDDIVNLQDLLISFDFATTSFYEVDGNYLVLGRINISSFLQGRYSNDDYFPLDLKIQSYGGYGSPLTRDLEPILFGALVQQTIANYHQRMDLGSKRSITEGGVTRNMASSKGDILDIVKTMINPLVYEGIAEEVIK